VFVCMLHICVYLCVSVRVRAIPPACLLATLPVSRCAACMVQITEHAFTSTAGAEVGRSVADTTSRVSGQRCAFLMACAMYHRLDEVWISLHPILLFTYVAQYCPALFSALSKRFGPKRVASFRAGERYRRCCRRCDVCVASPSRVVSRRAGVIGHAFTTPENQKRKSR
jgi:hypothetical protein